MEAKTKIIYIESARKKRKIQRIKAWVMSPTVVAFVLIFTIYGILASGYFINNNMQSKPNLERAQVELDNFHPTVSQRMQD